MPSQNGKISSEFYRRFLAGASVHAATAFRLSRGLLDVRRRGQEAAAACSGGKARRPAA